MTWFDKFEEKAFKTCRHKKIFGMSTHCIKRNWFWTKRIWCYGFVLTRFNKVGQRVEGILQQYQVLSAACDQYLIQIRHRSVLTQVWRIYRWKQKTPFFNIFAMINLRPCTCNSASHCSLQCTYKRYINFAITRYLQSVVSSTECLRQRTRWNLMNSPTCCILFSSVSTPRAVPLLE